MTPAAAVDLADEIAIVTGASSGIGRAIAIALAERGARVVVLARSASKLDELAARFDGRVLAVAGDLANETTIDTLFARTEAAFGSCTILINNAGHIEPALITDMSPESWDMHFTVNVRGAFLTCRRALPGMLSANRGAIVNVASISGVPGPQKFPGFTAYCAAKAALIGFTEALAVEVSGNGVRVNAISPGSVDTPMLRRVAPQLEAAMTPEEVAATILFLATSQSTPINGQNIHVYSS